MTDAMEVWKSKCLRVEWFDEVIRKILKVKDHQELPHNVNLIRERMEDLQRLLNTLADELKQTEHEMAKQNMDPLTCSPLYLVRTHRPFFLWFCLLFFFLFGLCSIEVRGLGLCCFYYFVESLFPSKFHYLDVYFRHFSFQRCALKRFDTSKI